MSIKRKIDGTEFEVIRPSDRYMRIVYAQYLADSWKKLLSPQPDAVGNDVVFLRTSAPDKVPLEREVSIFSDQPIFVAIISAVINTDDGAEFDNEAKRREEANSTIDAGDNPPKPQQVTIDGIPIVEEKLDDFRIESPEFILHVHEKSPLRDKLEVHYHVNGLPTVVVGYCVLINSLPARTEPYLIHTKARGQDDYPAEASTKVYVRDR